MATYVDGGTEEQYVHQRLNTGVFPAIDVLMANVARVSAHLVARAGAERGAVRLLTTTDDRTVVDDDEGRPWRTLAFIGGARTFARFHGPDHAADGAATAARLVADLADLDPPPAEVIPGFHDVRRRLDALDDARRADTCGRAVSCSAEVDAVLAQGSLARMVDEARAGGVLPQRTVHNDAKVENLLFDQATGRGLCLVDLDTVGPGTVLFDVGDLVRAGAATGREDGDPDAIDVDRAVVAAVLDGYARAGAGWLTPSEVDLLPLAGPLMALEAAARFLTDHLRGDVYFRITGPGHNLRRARNQLRILERLLAA